jgi:hypothetical protein
MGSHGQIFSDAGPTLHHCNFDEFGATKLELTRHFSRNRFSKRVREMSAWFRGSLVPTHPIQKVNLPPPYHSLEEMANGGPRLSGLMKGTSTHKKGVRLLHLTAIDEPHPIFGAQTDATKLDLTPSLSALI